MASVLGAAWWPAVQQSFGQRRLAHVASHMGSRWASLSERHPYSFTAVVSGCVLCSADITGQALTRREGQVHDWRRTAALTTWGMLQYGFAQKLWYSTLQRCIGQRKGLMTFLDVYVWSPLQATPGFYIATGMMRGQSFEESLAKLKRQWLEAFIGSALFWTPAVWANFTFIPPHSQILTLTIGVFMHQTWMSCLSNRDQHRDLVVQQETQPLFVEADAKDSVIRGAWATRTELSTRFWSQAMAVCQMGSSWPAPSLF